MILRSPAENENGGISFHRVLSPTRHSRARGKPGLLRRISLDTRFRGYDGTQAGLFVLIPKRVFSKEDTKSTKLRSLKISMSETFVSFVIFVVKENKGKVPGYPHKSLKLL
ncbi:MAG: hypothetical protein HYW03_02760 [Deltaproteobacteria bacterium]|nr:hypothetical protein [Deltaproteobacteria bacterium]